MAKSTCLCACQGVCVLTDTLWHPAAEVALAKSLDASRSWELLVFRPISEFLQFVVGVLELTVRKNTTELLHGIVKYSLIQT